MSSPIYTTDWVSGRLDRWPDLMPDLVGAKIRVLEIGTFEGRSAIWIARHIATHPQSSIDSLDNNALGGWEVRERALRNVRAEGLHSRIRAIRSASVSWLVRQHQPYDLIYVDGDHRGRAVLTDSVLAWRLLRPGGYLVWDDYGYRGRECDPPECRPAVVIDLLLQLWAPELEVVSRDYQVIARKKGV